MSRLFFDINVILDILTNREPYCFASSKLYQHVEEGEHTGLLSVLSLGTIYYLLEDQLGASKAIELVKILRDVLEFVEAPTKTANLAIDAGWRDFEDALQYFSALHGKADCVITRNPRNFKKSELPVFTPEEFLELEESNEKDT